MRFDEAVTQVTGPGQRFEITTIELNGRPTKVFANTPPSLRDLFASCRARGDAELLVYEDERWTGTQLADQIDAAGAMLAALGVEPGDRVAIAMRNYPEWIVSYAATTSIGAIVVALNAWWTTDELAYALKDSTPAVVIADGDRVQRLEPLLDGSFRVIAVRAHEPLPAGVDRWEDRLEPHARLPAVPIDADDDAHILYTSGTTGDAKGAVSTHRAILTALMAFGCRGAIIRAQAPPSGPAPYPTAYILCVPLFHVTGLVPVMLGAISGGFKLVMMYRWDPARALELIERERVTQFVGVPTMSWDLLECPDFAGRDTSSLASVGGGGAPAPPELVKRVELGFRGGRPSIGYGMTETNAYGPQNFGDDYIERPTSSGRVVPVMEITVRDEDRRDLPAGDQGEIWFRGPMLIRGYWERPDATASAIVDGWVRSGDIGRLDADGFIYVEDRAKDMVLRGGENVMSSEVEAAIYEHPSVYEAAVFGVPHERLGEEVAAAVVLKSGASLTVEELTEHLRTRLAPFKIPSQVELRTESLPRGATGKIQKRDLREEAAAR